MNVSVQRPPASPEDHTIEVDRHRRLELLIAHRIRAASALEHHLQVVALCPRLIHGALGIDIDRRLRTGRDDTLLAVGVDKSEAQ